MKKLIYIVAVFIGINSACKKGDRVENTAYVTLNGSENLSFVKFFNATPGSPTINFFVNNTKTSAVYVTTGKETGGIAYAGVYPEFGYSPIVPGASSLKANIVGGAAVDGGLNVFDGSINTEQGKYYSVFTSEPYNTTTKKIESTFVIADVKPALDTSKVFVRMINMYDGSPNLDLVQFDAANVEHEIISNVAYGTASAFVSIASPGLTNKYGFNDATTGLPIAATTLLATFVKGRAYTLVTRGAFGSVTFPLALTTYTTFY